MNPQNSDHVKVIFSNGLIEEGIVLEWTEVRAVLRSTSSDNLLIIQNTTRDVLAVKIYRDESQRGRTNANNRVFVDLPAEQVREKQSDLRALKLADLHKLRMQEERARARELTTTFQPSGLSPVKYGLPGEFRQPVLFDTATEDRRCNRGRQEPLSGSSFRDLVPPGKRNG